MDDRLVPCPMRPDGGQVSEVVARLEADWDAIVYDLDGTLVRLVVDWGSVRTAVQSIYSESGIELGDADLWTLLERAGEFGLDELVEETIAAYERAGAVRSELLPLGSELGAVRRPVGVCSLNAESACRLALERHGVADSVAIVVGRDSVSEWKPNPEPLEVTIDSLDATPDRTLFIGDTDRDAETARRAGTGFRFVSDILDVSSTSY